MSDLKTIDLKGIKKELSVIAAKEGVLLKPHIESILIDHVKNYQESEATKDFVSSALKNKK